MRPIIMAMGLMALWGCEPVGFTVLDLYIIDATEITVNTNPHEGSGVFIMYDKQKLYSKDDDISRLLHPIFRARIRYTFGTQQFETTCDVDEYVWKYLNNGMTMQSLTNYEQPPISPCTDFKNVIRSKWRMAGDQE
jgi:hypothetical protein